MVAFVILMDYFSSIPVTKKNLVTQKTQLLVSFMTFSVCLQVWLVTHMAMAQEGQNQETDNDENLTFH